MLLLLNKRLVFIIEKSLFDLKKIRLKIISKLNAHSGNKLVLFII